jgi:thioredoxin 1
VSGTLDRHSQAATDKRIELSREGAKMSDVKHVTTADFEVEVLRSEPPVLVDFYATWCMPCQLLSPALDRLAKEYAGRVKVVKVDVDQEPELASLHEIRGVPTLVLYDRGAVRETMVGIPPLSRLKSGLDAVAEGRPQVAAV